MTRGSPAAEIEPNAVLPSTTLGAASGGVFVKLNASARNSTFARSLTFVRLISATSAFRYAGPRTGLRELLPIVKIGAITNALVSNHLDVERCDAGNSGFEIRLGRCVPNPANALKLVS